MPVPKSSQVQSPRVLLRTVVYDRLLAAVESGMLEPGERLHDHELIEWLGTSRTPIREAISTLTREGLLEIDPNRSTRVTRLSADKFTAAISVLRYLFGGMAAEDLHLSVSARSGLQAKLARLGQEPEGDQREAVEALLSVCSELAAACGNPLLLDTVRLAALQARFHVAAPGVKLNWIQYLEDIDTLKRLCG